VANLDPRPSASADVITSYRVKWREAGKPKVQAESFGADQRAVALRFKRDVELAGNCWPDGWIKGVGYRSDLLAEPPVADQTFLTFAMQCVRDKTGIQPDTRQRYANQAKVLAYELGTQVAADEAVDATAVTIQNLTDRHVARWINARDTAGSSPKTIANWHGFLFEVMARAMEEGLRSNNPCAKTGKDLPRRDAYKTNEEMVFLEVEQVRLIAAAMWPGLPDPDQGGKVVAVGRPVDRELVLTAVGTGARWGEVTALNPADLVLQTERPYVKVNRAWKRNATGEFAKEGVGAYYLGGPKTKAGRRTVRIGAHLAARLREFVIGKGPRDLVFTATRGGMVDQPHFYEYRWKRAVELAQKNGLTKTPRFHDLRHTYAAWLISAGVPLPEIQRRLGHESIQTTVDVYGHLMEHAGDLADATIDEALRRCEAPLLDSGIALAYGEKLTPEGTEAAC
jgi:integrase